MKNLIPLLAFGTIMTAPALADSHSKGIPGYWLTANERGVIHIMDCKHSESGEPSLCGKIHWIIEGGLQKDVHNEDESLRDRPMCGLKLMGDFEPDGENEWEAGFIYKADDGEMYDANIELQEDGTLRLRGYVGLSMFGKTQIWTRVNKADYAKCKAAM